MTSVIFVASEETAYARFGAEGHSGYAEEGSDIICAAVSSTTELVVNILEQFNVDLLCEVDEETASVNVIILENGANAAKKRDIKRVVDGFKGYIADLAEAFPDYVTISTEV